MLILRMKLMLKTLTMILKFSDEIRATLNDQKLKHSEMAQKNKI